MFKNLFAEPSILLQGALVGLVIGFLFQKTGLTKFKVIVGQLLLKDFMVIKVLITAIIVGSIGIQTLVSINLPINLFLHSAPILAILIGGIIFGIGMAVLGYCPGTCVAAAGDGKKDAYWGIFGMLTGTLAYSYAYPFFQNNILSGDSFKKVRLSDLFGTSPWTIIVILLLLLLITPGLLKKIIRPTKELSERKK